MSNIEESSRNWSRACRCSKPSANPANAHQYGHAWDYVPMRRARLLTDDVSSICDRTPRPDGAVQLPGKDEIGTNGSRTTS